MGLGSSLSTFPQSLSTTLFLLHPWIQNHHVQDLSFAILLIKSCCIFCTSFLDPDSWWCNTRAFKFLVTTQDLQIIFPIRKRNVLDLLVFFGLMIFSSCLDPTIIFQSVKRTSAIGILCFFVPYTLRGLVAIFINHLTPLDHDILTGLPTIAAIQGTTAFPVISCFLTELHILNYEIRRLASSSSLVSDVCFSSVIMIKFAVKLTSIKSIGVTIGALFSSALLVVFIVLLFIQLHCMLLITHHKGNLFKKFI